MMLAAFLALSVLDSAPAHDIPVRVEPSQPVNAITLACGDDVRSVEVRSGKARVPADLPLPWRLALSRFEQLTYTREDLNSGRSIVLRELGIVRGMLRPPPSRGEQFTLTVLPAGTTSPQILKFLPDEQGAFTVRLAAGIYAGAFVGRTSGSRIRSGIIVKPGATTDLDVVTCDAAVQATMRIVDAKSGVPVPAATVTWDPPGALNSAVARLLYGPLWSTATDRAGLATIPSVGPLPIPVRWRIEAKGYVAAWTAQPVLAENRRALLPDIRLQVQAALIVRVRLSHDADSFRGAVIALGEPEQEDSRHYVTALRAPLREGESRLLVDRYGRKRVSILNATGKTLFYRDITLDSNHAVVDLDPEPVEIHGIVKRKDHSVPGALVTVADPQDARIILRQSRTEDDGSYSLTTFSGRRPLPLYHRVEWTGHGDGDIVEAHSY